MTSAGFDALDLQMIMPDFEIEEKPKAKATLEEIEKIKAARKASKIKGRNDPDDQESFYLVVVFRDYDECTGFLRACKLPETERYVDGVRLAENLGIEIKKPGV